MIRNKLICKELATCNVARQITLHYKLCVSMLRINKIQPFYPAVSIHKSKYGAQQ